MSYFDSISKYTDDLNSQRQNFETLINRAKQNVSDEAQRNFEEITARMEQVGGAVSAAGMGVHSLSRAKEHLQKIADEKGIDLEAPKGIRSMYATGPTTEWHEQGLRPIQMGEIGEIGGYQTRSTGAYSVGGFEPKTSEVRNKAFGMDDTTTEEPVSASAGGVAPETEEQKLYNKLKADPEPEDDSRTASGRQIFGEGDKPTIQQVGTGELRSNLEDSKAFKTNTRALYEEGNVDKGGTTGAPIYETDQNVAVPPDQQITHPRGRTLTEVETGPSRATGAGVSDLQQTIAKANVGLTTDPRNIETGRVKPILDPQFQAQQARRAAKTGVVPQPELDAQLTGPKPLTKAQTQAKTSDLLGDIQTKGLGAELDTFKTAVDPTNPVQDAKLSKLKAGDASLGADPALPSGVGEQPPANNLSKLAGLDTEGGASGLLDGGLEGAGRRLATLGGEEAIAGAFSGPLGEAAAGMTELVGAGLLVAGILHDVLEKPDDSSTNGPIKDAMAGKIGFDATAIQQGGGGVGVA